MAIQHEDGTVSDLEMWKEILSPDELVGIEDALAKKPPTRRRRVPSRRDSLDVLILRGGVQVLAGRIKYAGGKIVAEGEPWLQRLIAMPHGDLGMRGRLVGPDEGRTFLDAVMEQYRSYGIRCAWSSEES